MKVSQAVIEKGEAIVAEGRIRRIRKGRYMVEASSGRSYFVHKGKCRCRFNDFDKATERHCSHEFAALLAARLGVK